MTTAEGLVVRKSVTVAAPLEHAFELFTERIGDWWPLASHSLHGEKAKTAVFEGREGGRVYERTAAGLEAEWGTVLAYDPPNRFLLEWRVNPAQAATELEVTFVPSEQGTRVDLEHRGWESEERRADYDTGWEVVLGRFTAVADG
jgi:uncharacterized protein YndB with AHSA1/START domain